MDNYQMAIPKRNLNNHGYIATDQLHSISMYILQGGVLWYINCPPDSYRESHRSSVSFGHERPPDPTVRLSEIRPANLYQLLTN
jgi:hypothetical protein